MIRRRYIAPQGFSSALLLIAFLMIVSGSIAPGVVAEDSNPETIALIHSRFMLWDNSEKMVDPVFTVWIIGSNGTAWYEITVNDNVTRGSFNGTHNQTYRVTDDLIFRLEVRVDNVTILSATNIVILEGLSGSGVSAPSSPFTINLRPWEWTEKQRNIVLAMVVASLSSLLIGYRIALRYRKMHGVKEVS